MITNLGIYLSIAEEALQESESLENAALSPQKIGETRSIKFVPERRSFKSSLVAIAFAGIYLDALLYIISTQLFGKSKYKKLEGKPYADRLKFVGVTDPDIIAACTEFRAARNDLVHENAFEISEIAGKTFYPAQSVAKDGLSIVKQVATLLNVAT
jgi:hypothetical protein